MKPLKPHFRPQSPLQLEHVIAPNGRSVAENFKAWFRDSKVVDAAGHPLVLYHGTTQDFTAFDKKCIGDNFRADEAGFFFTSDPKSASDYAENDTVGLNKRLECHVMPVYVALQRPLIVDDAFLRSEGMERLGVTEDTISFWDVYQSLILEWASDRRADGVILVDNSYRPTGEPTRLVVAFEPHQVKSALGNSGLYAPLSASLHDLQVGPGLVATARRRRAINP
ncbi:ADP-ribosyltransferase-containing protein [Paucibacter soli]|uniref:ADP-ribosyltransferase-containing protein n=1 Tax=Paucibacter soli TaxID=3133433 RepID=UPI0030A8492A